jgi:hypothetical protein
LGRGDAQGARAHWAAALAQWQSDANANPVGFASAARGAAIAASKLDEWREAADHFERASNAVAEADHLFAVGLAVDASYAWFRSGEPARFATNS